MVRKTPSMFWTVILSCCGTWWHMQHPNILAWQDPTIFCGLWIWVILVATWQQDQKIWKQPSGSRKVTSPQNTEHLQVTWVLVMLRIMYIVLTFLGPGIFWPSTYLTQWNSLPNFSFRVDTQNKCYIEIFTGLHINQLPKGFIDIHMSHVNLERLTPSTSCDYVFYSLSKSQGSPWRTSSNRCPVAAVDVAVMVPVAGSGWAHWSTERHPWKHPMAAAKTPVSFLWIKMDKTICIYIYICI